MQSKTRRLDDSKLMMKLTSDQITEGVKLFNTIEGKCMTGFLNSYLLITKVSNYLKENGKAWDNDVYFENQLNDYFDLLRTLLKRRDVDIISKALILEIHELRASDWHFDEKISMFYEEKLKELTRIQFKDAQFSLEQNKPFNDSSSSVPMENCFVNGENLHSNSMENRKISSSESAKCNGNCNCKATNTGASETNSSAFGSLDHAKSNSQSPLMNESPTRINSTLNCTNEYCFEVKVGDNTLTLITGDISLGREALQVLQEHFAKIKSQEKGMTNERSITSGNNSPANSSITSSIINDSNVTRRTTRKTSNLRNIRVVVTNDKRSSTQSIHPETDSNSCVSVKSISKSFCLTYDRDFLLSLKDKLMCSQEPIYFDRIAEEMPCIIKREE